MPVRHHTWTLHAQLGSPRKVNIDRGPGQPEYLVDSAYLFKADLGLLTKNIVIVDHSESFFIKSPPLQELQPTIYYAAPEVLFGSSPDFCSDVWAIGCLIYDMRSGTPLLYLAIQNRPFFAVYRIILVLGRLPPCWNLEQFNDGGFLDPYVSKPLEHPFPQIAEFPIDVQVKDIEAERISLPTIKIGSKEGKPPSKAWKMKPASSAIRAHIKNNPSIYWKPFPSGRSVGIDRTEGSDRRIEIEDAMSKKMTPLPKISAEESVSLTDLLSKFITYEPEQRISLEDLAQHPWLTVLAEGN